MEVTQDLQTGGLLEKLNPGTLHGEGKMKIPCLPRPPWMTSVCLSSLNLTSSPLWYSLIVTNYLLPRDRELSRASGPSLQYCWATGISFVFACVLLCFFSVILRHTARVLAGLANLVWLQCCQDQWVEQHGLTWKNIVFTWRYGFLSSCYHLLTSTWASWVT